MPNPSVPNETDILSSNGESDNDLHSLFDASITIPPMKSLYRFPWSTNDNPQGWVEITDHCNLVCRGCYRHKKDGHKSLDEIKEEIQLLKQWRNIDSVTLAGGEPFIHPDIVDIVDYIHRQKLKAMSLSNGKALTPQLLKELKKAGLVKISLHIDSGQTRDGWTGKTEAALNDLRQYYADMLWKFKIKCNFNITVTIDNFHIIPMLLEWALGNKGKVDGFTFILARGLSKTGFEYYARGKKIVPNFNEVGIVSEIDPANFKINSKDVYRYIKKFHPRYMPSAFLGGTIDHTSYKWLVSINVCRGKEIIGSFSPFLIKCVQTINHILNGRYIIVGKGNMGRSVFLLALIDKGIRKALRNFLAKPLSMHEKIYTFGISIVQPPDILPDGQTNMCEGCPDITFYKGRLVHSCRMEEHRLHDQYVEVRPISYKK